MSIPRARVVDLMKAQCKVFATTFNPEGTRLGNKVLRQRLRGPATAAYYPRKIVTIKDVKAEFGPELDTWDPDEEARFEYIEEWVSTISRLYTHTNALRLDSRRVGRVIRRRSRHRLLLVSISVDETPVSFTDQIIVPVKGKKK
ncbi:mitochondrial 37S ribosomal protein S27, putative [Cordyceps militaris CM01]|uniref:Small ribosomal subunit protein mS33 n=1 Tax=Cordyceps militaris (strain CM01) TaxID=983644 RepID=G3JFW6_CORMM|nr:mitochondrial 37S ribosomal protein S27, putative [Cordyceps militaris CM01]EGX93200.1 mitochondrial 37S ribosomal protein S27, putative [Cordyceps militaris CM01]